MATGCPMSGRSAKRGDALDIVREQVLIGSLGLVGCLDLVAPAAGLVVFAHSSGSSHLSPGNQQLAGLLHQHRLSTLLFDLLSPSEATDRHQVLAIELLADRIGQAIDWARRQPALSGAGLGLLGTGTGAAVAFGAAAAWPSRVMAVVSCGGRPDLASVDLPEVQAPTLLVVGAHDPKLLDLNRRAMRLLRCEKRLEVVPSPSQGCDAPGVIDSVAHLAGAWFSNHFSPGWRS